MFRSFAVIAALAVGSIANAHFPWMVVDDQGNVQYFFGEGLTDRTYKMPPPIAKAKVTMRNGDQTMAVDTKMVESDDFIGLQSVASVPKSADLVSQATYGVYHGSKLQYYTQHLGGEMPTEFSQCKPFAKMDLQVHAVDTENGGDVFVLWKGKPLEGAEVKLFCDDVH